MILIKNNEAFRKSIDQIATFVDECNIHFSPEGMKILAFDNAQIIYLEYSLAKESIEGEMPSAIFGINVSEFNKIISKVNSNEELHLDILEQGLDIIIKGSYIRTFSFPQKIVDEKKLDVYLEEYPINLSVDADILKDVFNGAKLVSDSILFDCKKSEISVSSEGLYGKYKTNLVTKCEQEFKAKFSSTHVSNMLKNAFNDTKVDIKLSQRFPFYLSYNIGENNLRFFLAHMFI